MVVNTYFDNQQTMWKLHFFPPANGAMMTSRNAKQTSVQYVKPRKENKKRKKEKERRKEERNKD